MQACPIDLLQNGPDLMAAFRDQPETDPFLSDGLSTFHDVDFGQRYGGDQGIHPEGSLHRQCFALI